MKRLESPEDYMRGVVTYELLSGERVTIDARLVQKYGAGTILKEYGIEVPTERIPVFYCGEKIGTVPADFDPVFIRSKSFLYDPRPGDFVRGKEGWIASKTLGSGDFKMIEGFLSN